MRKHLVPLLAALIAAALTAGLATARNDHQATGKSASAYEVGFWADVPYSEVQKTTGVPNLIADMNRQRLAFSVHAGDIKSGGTRCDDPVYSQAEAYFNSLRSPAIYTPGDNEWTDCDRANNGSYSSRERLDYIRRTLFDDPDSFGQRQIRLEHQAAPYIENTRWQRGRVTYAALHVVGTDNNLGQPGPDPEEWAARDRATNAWLRETFAKARRSDAAAVLLTIQANPGFDMADPTRSPSRDPKTLLPADGFHNFLSALREETVTFRRPVVLVHGDSHYFRIDKPLLDAQGRRLENFTRLETPGGNNRDDNGDVHWVKVRVEPKTREVFSFQPQIVPGNRVAVPAPARHGAR